VDRFTTAFIGAGNMSRSIIAGMLATGFPAEDLAASNRSAPRLEVLRELGLTRLGQDNRAAAAGADVVVLAVKPQGLEAVCRELAGLLGAQQLVISLAAGIESEAIAAWIGPGPALLRCVPNTPSRLGAGASMACACRDVTPLQRDRAQAILDCLGITRWTDDEELLHAVTALSGSGPAYFFTIMQAMIDEAVRMGLDEGSARTLCAQTCLGAGRMLAECEDDAAALARAVTSPGGTTERALAVLAEEDLGGVLSRAMRAAQLRSQELAMTLGASATSTDFQE
jgi:pyrroline-5-carboxylate reductase